MRATEQRKAIRRELRRLAASNLSVYLHGPAGSVRFSERNSGGRATGRTDEVLAALHALPDGAGPGSVLDAIGRADGAPLA
jgi:hypothetical protein